MRRQEPAAPARRRPGELDAGLDNILFDVWLLARATTALLDNVLRASGLDADEFAIYSILASRDGMTPTELARWMAAPASTVSSYVKRFERRGHVRRVPHPDDGRSYCVELTAAGRRAHVHAGVLFLPVLRQVTDSVGTQGPGTHRRMRALHQTVEDLQQQD